MRHRPDWRKGKGATDDDGRGDHVAIRPTRCFAAPRARPYEAPRRDHGGMAHESRPRSSVSLTGASERSFVASKTAPPPAAWSCSTRARIVRRQVLAYGQARIPGRFLRRIGRLAPEPMIAAGRPAQHLDPARVETLQTGQAAQQGRFARAVDAGDPDDLALLDVKVDTLESGQVDHEVAYSDHAESVVIAL